MKIFRQRNLKDGLKFANGGNDKIFLQTGSKK